MKISDKQRIFLREALRVHDENVKFADKLLSEFHQSVSCGDEIFIRQVEIILDIDKENVRV